MAHRNDSLGEPFKGHCQRCGKKCSAHIMSMFNTQDICLACKAAEQKHPDYARAIEADHAAIRQGNYNFPGIGLPRDLV